ncbi:MAG: ArsA family ATPase [Deltaproteobacteria bacterium]|nr:ArsA family ATPase [Deltaproteobacteria bacterium]MBW2697446.1 ArsA family ATPase [Deltaproteobacteria bacterium]
MRVLLHTGKGGVGKTTLSLATALGAARFGHRVFVLSTDAAHSLGDALGRSVGAAPVEITANVVAQEVSALEELDRSWSDIQSWLRELLRDETNEMLAEELLVFPGLEELMALRAIREVEATGDFDVCVVDCAPTGSTLRMLRFPDALRIFMEHLFEWEKKGVRLLRPIMRHLGSDRLLPREEFFDAFERLYRDVEDVRQILLDSDRTSARLVVNPARIVVAEARRSFAYLSLYGVGTDAVLVNRLLPGSASSGYFARWAEREREELHEIEESFPVPILAAPLERVEPIGVDALRGLADRLFGERDPAGFYSRVRPIRLRKRAHRTVMEIELPGASKEEVDVILAGAELHIRVRDARRRIALPASIEGREIESVRLTEGVLELLFSP